MTTLIFVHGTGTRQPIYDRSFNRIKQEVQARRPDVHVEPCFWAGEYGVRLNAGGISIPNYEATRSLDGEVDDSAYDIALWAMLYQDPLYELRLTARLAAPDAFPSEGAMALDARFRAWQPTDAEPWAEAGLLPYAAAARDTVVASDLYAAALAAPDDESDLLMILARAVVAQAMADAEAADDPAEALTDADLRDGLVFALSDSLSEPGTRGFGDWVKERASDLVLNAGTAVLAARRGKVMDISVAPVGDVMFYMTHGEGIRRFVADRVRAAQEPVVLFAHSLGGIISLELLAEQALPQVKLLVTVGTPALYLYELDAHPGLRYSKQPQLPAHFPRWINIYDQNDFFSFLAAGLFPGKVEDIEIASRQPFPNAHSSYWTTNATWDAVVAALP